ncbi:MAG TPA: c-type cytochrome [Nevskiaceae bacterium]|nr:c-type cytochrome [Nevskiaceae bacterium]
MKRIWLLLALCTPLMAQAQGAADLFTGGDAKAGEAKAAVCAACHGPAGVSAVPEWPKLAGQHSAYIAEQLKQYKSGARQNAVMLGQAMNLSEQDMKDLGAYYAAQAASPGVASEASVAVAEKIYRGGVASRGIPACSGCHGPTGTGNAAAKYPRLAGQHAAYTALQLKAYRSGERAAGANGQMMAAVASQLSDEEIEALASYLNGLQ